MPMPKYQYYALCIAPAADLFTSSDDYRGLFIRPRRFLFLLLSRVLVHFIPPLVISMEITEVDCQAHVLESLFSDRYWKL